MRKKSIFKFLLTCWITTTVFSSCNDIDLSNISNDVLLDESLILPIGQGNVSVKDLLTKFVSKSNIVTDKDTINYVDNYVYEYLFKDVDPIASAVPRNISITGFATGTVPANSPVPTTVGNQLIDMGLDPASTKKRVDSTYVTSTSIGITVSTSNITVASSGSSILPSDLKVSLEFPTIYNQSDRSKVIKNIPYSFTGPYNLVLNNVIVDTHGQQGVPVLVKLTSGSRAINFNSSSEIKVAIKFNTVSFTVCYGLFQPASIQTTSITVPLDMLQSLPIGMQFANPKAIINIKSNIGSWLDYKIEYVYAYNKNNPTEGPYALFNDSKSTTEVIKPTPLPIPGAFWSWPLRALDKNYGTTNKLFETNDKLDNLEYKFSLTTNSASPVPSYVVPGMKMTANVKIQIPLYLEKGSTYNYTDTIEYENKEISYVDQGILVLKVTNGLPAQAKFTMKLLDANKQIVNSTLNDSIYTIKSASVGDDGIATTSTVTNFNINLTSAQLTDIKNAKAVSFTVFLSGQEGKEIQFTTKDLITAKLGIFAKGGKTVNIGSDN